jgi:hypothetical protein
MRIIETGVASSVSILTSSRWGGGANDRASIERIHGEEVGSRSECSLAAQRNVAGPDKLPLHSLLNHKRDVEGQLQCRTTESQMNSDEVNWLLQTIKDPENAKRFLQAQHQRGRIP